MNVFFLIVVVAALAGVALLLYISQQKRVTQKRLDEIRSTGSSSYSSSTAANKKQVISSEKFEKTKLASNERIKRMTTTMTNELNAAGLGDDPIRVILVWIIIVIVLPMIENLLGMDFLIQLLTIGVTAIGPVLYIQIKKSRRKEKFEKQLPHALDIICNALKAGYTFQASMNNVAKELDDPISEEFLMAFRETQFGVPLTDALKNMAKRTSSKDIELLDVAVSVQTNVGGNMIEILENISSTLTAKHDLEEDIKVKTSSGKITGIMLAVLPIFLLIALNFMNPEYISIFFEETVGRYMLIFCAVWELIGFMFIRKILNVKF